jgi:tetratricopeptide (TPR) repeat protein
VSLEIRRILAFLAPACFLVATLTLFSAGRGGREKRGVTWRRLVGLSVLGGVAITAPGLVWIALELLEAPLRANAALAAAASGLIFLLWVRIFSSEEAAVAALPPLAEDQGVVARTAELARALGVAPPPLRVLESQPGDAHAVLAGFLSVDLLATRSLLTSFPASERDAILGHELAHAWTRTRVPPILVVPAAALLATLASGRLPLAASVALGFAAATVLRRVVGRRVEVACDRAGARVAGRVPTARALRKLHAVNHGELRGWPYLIAQAMTTHPPLATRVAAIARGAPPEERAELAVEPRARTERLTSALALVAALVAILAALAAADPVWRGVPEALLVGVAIVPALAFRFAGAREAATQEPLLGPFEFRARRRARLALAGLAGSTALLAVLFLRAGGVDALLGDHPVLAALSAAAALATLLPALVMHLRWLGRDNVRVAVGQAIAARRYEQAAEVGAKFAAAVARDPIVRLDLAVAAALAGDRAGAIARLELLEREVPMATLWVASLLLASDPERSLEAARRVQGRVPGDPAPAYAVARALRKLGRGDEARREVEAGLARNPRSYGLRALAGQLALDRGETDTAERVVRELEAEAPRPWAPLLRAALALSLQEDTAPSALEEARRAVAETPAALLEDELEALYPRRSDASSKPLASSPSERT